RIQNQWVLNPTFQQLEYSDVDIVVAGTENGILMVEGGSMEITEEEVADALEAAHAGIRELCALQREFVEPVKQPEMEWTPVEPAEALRARVEELAGGRVADAMQIADKAERNEALAALREEIQTSLAEEFPEQESEIRELLYLSEKASMRRQIIEKGVRSDGRKPDEIRPINCEVGLLPRTHGSALFTRGSTQSLGVVTLGTQ